MFNKKILFSVWSLCCLLFLTAWDISSVSRQKELPSNYEKAIKKQQKLHKQAKENRKEQRQFAHLAKQKNQLAYLADYEGFIWFKNEQNPTTYFLSNSYPSTIKIWNMKFICAEAALQAAKFLHQPEIAAQFTTLDGDKAWKLSQKLSYQQRTDWYQVRENLMFEILQTKFMQHPELSELLLATGDAYLVENRHRDAFWADGGDGRGKNRLGNLLMQTRGTLGGIGIVPKPAKYKKFVSKNE